jgi:hypothetical protein
MNEDTFMDWLQCCLDVVGCRLEAIKGYFKEAKVSFREDDGLVDYRLLYLDELEEYIRTGTVN